MRFRRRFSTAGLCGLTLLFTPQQPFASNIYIASHADGTSCYMPVIPPGGSGTAYIFAILGGDAAASGIFGAEFSVTGMPPEMMVSATPAPSNVNLGDPFGSGCNIAFPSCQPQSGGNTVLLYTVNLTAPPSGVPHYVLDVSRHQTPSSPTYPCPLLYLCDPPAFTRLCVNGSRSGPGPLLQVPSNPSPADGATNVATSADLSWGLEGPTFCCGLGTSFTTVYLGTAPDPPPIATYEHGALTFDPGPLEALTTYYWRIRWTPDHDCGNQSGPVWSFTTSDKVGIETTTWQAVKAMFR
jgi:hypothetical protein